MAQVGSRIVTGYNCRRCSSNRSRGEIELHDFLHEALQGHSVEHSVRGLAHGIEIDILISDLKIGIEYNGNYWHSDAKLSESEWGNAEGYHRFKIAAAEAAGIELVFVWEDDWKARREQVETALLGMVRGEGVDSLLTVLSKG